jgi:uncharacterized protein YodC (DUF2158 family)
MCPKLDRTAFPLSVEYVTDKYPEVKKMSDQIKAGDVVQLSPGGPKMILSRVENIAGEKKGWCTWFDGTLRREGAFALTSLKPASN